MDKLLTSQLFEHHGPVFADRALESLWRQGKLQQQWVKKYPELFDERDLEIFVNQPKHHFFEASGAIWWLEQHGYLSLVEKYDIKTPQQRHPRKESIFHHLVSPSQFDRIWVAKNAHGRTGPPDLFVYKPDLSDWFLCDAKGPSDIVRPPQEAFWSELAQIFNKRVRILNFVWHR